MPCRVISMCLFSGLTVVSLFISGCGLFGGDDAYSVSRYEGPAFGADDVEVMYSMEFEDDQLTLRGAKGDGDRRYGGYVFVITLSRWTEELPKLEDVWFGPEGGGVGRVLPDVRLDIQDWDPPERVSGVIYARFPSGGKTSERFWVEHDGSASGN